MKKANKQYVIKSKFPDFILNPALIEDEFTTIDDEAVQRIVVLSYTSWKMFETVCETINWRTRWQDGAEGYDDERLELLKRRAISELGDSINMDRLLDTLQDLFSGVQTQLVKLDKLDGLDQLIQLQQLQLLPPIRDEIAEIKSGEGGLADLASLLTLAFGGPEAALFISMLQALPDISTITSHLLGIKEDLVLFLGGGSNSTPITEDLNSIVGNISGVELALGEICTKIDSGISVLSGVIDDGLAASSTPYLNNLSSLPQISADLTGIEINTRYLRFLESLTYLQDMALPDAVDIPSGEIVRTVDVNKCKMARSMVGSIIGLFKYMERNEVILKVLGVIQLLGISAIAPAFDGLLGNLAIYGLESGAIMEIMSDTYFISMKEIRAYLSGNPETVLAPIYFANDGNKAFEDFDIMLDNSTLTAEEILFAKAFFSQSRFNRYFAISNIDDAKFGWYKPDGVTKKYDYESFIHDCSSFALPASPCGNLLLVNGVFDPLGQGMIGVNTLINGTYSITFKNQTPDPTQNVLFRHSYTRKIISYYVTWSNAVPSNTQVDSFTFDCNETSSQYSGNYPQISSPVSFEGTGLTVTANLASSTSIATLHVEISDII